MVKRFGAYFKDLSLTLGFDGTIRTPIPQECEELIQCIKRCCRYERLTLDAFSYEGVMRPTDLNILAQLFTNQHLKSIALLGVTCKDVRVLLSQRLNGCLERLSIQEHGEDTKLRLPILASQLTRLRALHLRSFGVSDDLIVSLADPGRAPLRELGIEVLYDWDCNPDTGVTGLPRVKASSWIRLRTHSPCLHVHVEVTCWIPHDELADFLLPEIPVASISFSGNSKCGDIRSIADMFFSTLRKFVDSTYTSELDAELVYMVTKCSHLVHLEFNGALRVDTIRELAGLRGSRWVHFLVSLDKVVDSHDDVSIKQLAADVARITRK